MVTFAFRCNIACTFCMVEDVLTVLPGTSLDEFRQAVERNRGALDGVSRIIFSGGEVTLSKELPAYAAYARSLPGIEHVRIQTNATRLAKRDYLRSLIDVGIDEYFVSFHAPDAELYTRIAQRERAFDEIIAGIENIAAEGASLTTNTAIVEDNYRRLGEIVDRIAPFHPRSMEFWNYWPRADEWAKRQMSARIGDVRPHLVDALERSIRAGFPPVVKWFPRCLLGSYALFLDDSQPPALISDEYWTREPAYSCLYEGVCADAGKSCSGLSHPYIYQHGWEERLLQPRRVEDRREGSNATKVETRSLVKDGADKSTHAAAIAGWLAEFGLTIDQTYAGFTFSKAELGRGVAMLALFFVRGDDEIELRLDPRDERRPAFARTSSYNLVYRKVAPTLEPDAQQLAGVITRIVADKDPGGRGIPG